MLIRQDAEHLQYDYGIIELDVLESKKGNQLFLFYNLVNHLCSERTDLKNFTGSLVSISKCHKIQKVNLC